MIPKEFIPAIEAGIAGALTRGVVAGYPLVDVIAELVDGGFHEVDSDEISFQIAASMAFADACKAAEPTLLEPMMKVEVITPSEYMGSVIGDINQRHGNVHGMHQRANAQVIDADVPLSAMFGYVDALRTLTQGRGTYTMQFGHYERIPAEVLGPLLFRLRGY